jgi:hypothetical protein
MTIVLNATLYFTTDGSNSFASLKEYSSDAYLLITTDLYNVLLACREYGSNVVPRRFGIDSVCIDPTSSAEKNSHLAQMTTIYREAAAAIVWDGKELSVRVPLDAQSSNPGYSCCHSAITTYITQPAYNLLTMKLAFKTTEKLLSGETRRPYIYSDLQHKDSIRVLELYPGALEFPLLCKLLETCRITAGFQALSYAWGSPIFSETIYEVGSGTTIQVTKNLYQALQALRFSDQVQTLWVDAVCINQNSFHERNHQVKQMADIYRQASTVLVWLGHEECGQVMRSSASIGNTAMEPTPAIGTNDEYDQHDGISDTLDAVNSKRRIEELVLACDIASMGLFFGRRCFQRGWVLQEFVLARKVRIFAGQNEISLEYLESAIDTLHAHEYVLLTKVSSFDHDPWELYLHNLGIVSDMVQFRSSALRMGIQRAKSLHRCCRLLIDRNCSDVRDNVYAALGLANDDLAIKPDYSLGFAEVNLDMSRKSLLAGDFSVLHYADTQWKNTSRSTRPSFVALLRNEPLNIRPLPLGGNEFPVYPADLSRLSTVQTLGKSSIEIQGVRIDEVSHVDTLAHVICNLAVGLGIPTRFELFDVYTHVEALQNRLPSDAFKLAFWRTVNLGFRAVREDVPYYEKSLDFRFLDLSYRENIIRCAKNRAFFVTKRGYIGIGPRWTAEHDQIVIFDGSETPFILRKAAEESGTQGWKLIGDSYVDGWMDGSYCEHEIVDDTHIFDDKYEHGRTWGPNETPNSSPYLRSEPFVLC